MAKPQRMNLLTVACLLTVIEPWFWSQGYVLVVALAILVVGTAITIWRAGPRTSTWSMATMFDIPRHSMVIMAAVIGVLATATVVQFVLAAMHSDRDYTELRQRIKSWWWMIAALFAVLILSANAAIVFFSFLSFLALKEFLSIVPTQAGGSACRLLGLCVDPVECYWVA